MSPKFVQSSQDGVNEKVKVSLGLASAAFIYEVLWNSLLSSES
jgi:hypothetical protein